MEVITNKQYKSDWDISDETWNKFMSTFDMDSDISNFKYPFKTMTKKYGKQISNIAELHGAQMKQ